MPEPHVATYKLFTKGTQRKALEYTNWLLKNAPDIKSILDIGCADGVVATLLPNNITYHGFDVGADIYSRTQDQRISYIENVDGLKTAIRNSDAQDVALLYDVLEHTDDFTSFFELALDKSQKYVLVSLPNEQSIWVILNLLRGQDPGAHGLRMLKAKPGHRHQWFISIAEARRVLSEVAAQHGFRLISEVYCNFVPGSVPKAMLYGMLTAPLPIRLRSIAFAFLFAKT